MTASAIQYPLAAGGATVRVVQWGLKGPAVLLLHGLGSHAEVWSAVAPGIGAEGYRCLAVDLPGHGLSSKGADFPYTLDGHIAWLDALLEALGERAVHLVGSSLGGLWAAGFANRFAARIASLTLIGAVGLEPLALERRRWTAEYLAHMDRQSIAERLRRAVGDPRAIDECFIEQTHRMNNSAGAAQAFAALARYYLERINDDLQLEALRTHGAALGLTLIWGKADVTVSYAGAVAAARRIPGSTLVALEETRHVPQLERPASVRAVLSRRLRGERLERIDGGELFVN